MKVPLSVLLTALRGDDRAAVEEHLVLPAPCQLELLFGLRISIVAFASHQLSPATWWDRVVA